MRRKIRPILKVAQDESCAPYLFRLFESSCDYTGHARYLGFRSAPQWNIWADGRPDAAACLLHLGRAVVEVSRRHPEAVIEVRPWERHRSIRHTALAER
jgi:hypothetical protein